MPFGTKHSPVPHDPMSKIVDVDWGAKADIVIVRTGTGLPSSIGTGGRHMVAFPGHPGKDITRDALKQIDAHKDQFYVGTNDDNTDFNPNPPDNKVYRDTPWRGGDPPNIGITTASGFALRIPSSEEWGNREEGYNGEGMYYWHCGWHEGGCPGGRTECVIINIRKMRSDFKKYGDKTLPPDDPRRKDIQLFSMSTEIAYQVIGPAYPPSGLLVEFAAYKFTEPDVSGDFFTTTTGAVYANSVRKIARKVVRVQDRFFRAVNFFYNLKGGSAAEISFDGGTAFPEHEYGQFEQQPGG